MGESGAALHVLARVLGGAGDEARVALHHLRPDCGGRLHGVVLRGLDLVRHPSIPSSGAVVLFVPSAGDGVVPAGAVRAAATASIAVRSSFASAVP